MNFRNMIKVCNLTKIYNKNKSNQIVALDNISLDINTGDFIAIMGPSGAGKSTLLHMISGIDNYDSGNIIVPDNCTIRAGFRDPHAGVRRQRRAENVICSVRRKVLIGRVSNHAEFTSRLHIGKP